MIDWNDDIVILFGSGISIWKPSLIPSGQKITSIIFSFLLGKDIFNRIQDQFDSLKNTEYNNWLRNTPFEQINDCCPVDLAKFYSTIFRIKKPNIIHKKLAELAESNKISALITTNYDCGVELCLSPSSNVNSFYDPNKFDPKKIPLFKIHGSSEYPDSIIYKLSQESKLPLDKEHLLNILIRNRHLVIIGYSGLDFEICPSIVKANPSKITWFCGPKKLESEGFKYINENIEVECELGDFKNGLPEFSVFKKLKLSTECEDNITELLARYVNNKRNKLLWSLKLSDRIGLPFWSNKLIGFSVPFLDDPLFIEEKAKADFNSGKYFFAEKNYNLLYYHYLKNNEYFKSANIIIYGKSESQFCSGKYLSGLLSLVHALIIQPKYFKYIFLTRISRLLVPSPDKYYFA